VVFGVVDLVFLYFLLPSFFLPASPSILIITYPAGFIKLYAYSLDRKTRANYNYPIKNIGKFAFCRSRRQPSLNNLINRGKNHAFYPDLTKLSPAKFALAANLRLAGEDIYGTNTENQLERGLRLFAAVRFRGLLRRRRKKAVCGGDTRRRLSLRQPARGQARGGKIFQRRL
jgi:hypothetical protein